MTATGSHPNLHIYAPDYLITRRVMLCPTCERRCRFVIHHYVWHDPRWTCCACGDSWSPEGRDERPFMRGWRKEAIRKARRDWGRAVTKAEMMTWLLQEVHEITGST